MSKALYRKYRSKSLSEIVGQSHVTDILARSLEKGIVAHAYLLTGPRGVGKTSIARILAHEINQLPYDDESSHLDIIEIDAASNNGVEDVRELREKVQVAPVSARKKVYIIDEVHMLSKAAFNALLKTLEEPPEHVVFILATTDSDKLPATIISRTQQFNFRTIRPEDAVKHLRFIADQEKIKAADDALELIALRGEGSFRDSISLLDQLQSLADKKTGITTELVERTLGLAPAALVSQLLEAYQTKDLQAIVTLLNNSDALGIQSTVLTSQLIRNIQLQLTEQPQLVTLLDQLLEVSKSSRPNIKLLTILAAHALPKSKHAALQAPQPEVSAPIAELERQATKERVAVDLSSRSTTFIKEYLQPEIDKAPEPLLDPGTKPFFNESSRKGEPRNNEQKNTSPIPINLDWKKLIEHTRQHYVAVYSVLAKCSYELNSVTLTIYTGNKFYKKKLDDNKHRLNLQKALEEIGAAGLTIEAVGSPPPPKDGLARTVAAIMGGGEEVEVDV